MIDLQKILEKIKPYVLKWAAPKFYLLTTALSSTSWNGDAYTNHAKTLIDLSAVFNAPAGIKAILARVSIRDSGSSGADCYICLGSNDSVDDGMILRCSGLPNDSYTSGCLIVPCDANGDIYYQTVTSSAEYGVMDVSLYIFGYWL